VLGEAHIIYIYGERSLVLSSNPFTNFFTTIPFFCEKNKCQNNDKYQFAGMIMDTSYGSVWYSFMSSFTSSFTTSTAKQPTLCPTLWSASLKTHSHKVKHMVKLKNMALSSAHEVAHGVIF
jgi:hypothetical protein